MREIPGTVTDRGLDHLIPNTRTDLEAGISEYNVVHLDEYQDFASEVAIYPRVYTEDQVRLIVADVALQLGDTTTPLGEMTNSALDCFETPFNRLVYPILGLVGEAGEIANKLKKVARDDQGKMDLDKSEDIEKELGDVFWYIAAIASELRVKLSHIASDNITKLFSRKQRGVLGGSGDNR
jgi:NTP pyrophosphatase (non-canonical NTP hydrolase)